MCTVALTYDKDNKQANDLLANMLASGLFYVVDMPEKKDRVYVDNGRVKMEIVEDETDLDDFRNLLHEMVDLEYSLP